MARKCGCGKKLYMLDQVHTPGKLTAYCRKCWDKLLQKVAVKA